jgi:hypothetical protein
MRRLLQPLAAGALLSWCVTVRWPAATPLHSWLAPASDIAVLLGLLALFAPRPSWQLPRALTGLLCALLLAVRVGRVAEGVCQRYLDRSFHVASDLTLVPEFARLAWSTLGPLRASAAALAMIALLGLLWPLTAAALRVLTRALSDRSTGNLYLGALALLGALGVVLPSGSLFSSPASPRLVSELELWLGARGLFDDPAHAARRRVFAERFRDRQAQLQATASDLGRSGHVDVHVILVEAYGRTVQSTPLYAQILAPGYHEFESQLSRAGFSVCSQFVQATVFGGNSWLTHATLETGVPMLDQFDYALLLEHTEISSLAKKFRSAGYRTVSVKPGTTRAAPQLRMYGFDREYAARDFDYHGPPYAWAPMPDQFVLERVAERELRAPSAPLFIEYALISSHFPFNPHPDYVANWASLGDGSIYQQLPSVQFAEAQGELSPQVLGYLTSIIYDLHTLREFITRYLRADSLVLVLGDHQPIAPVAGEDHSRATPMHVIAGHDALLQPFRDHGCTPGMLASPSGAVLKMEDLGMTVLQQLSAAAPSAGAAP